MLKRSSQLSLPRPTGGWQLFSPDEMDQTEKEVSEARPLLHSPQRGWEWSRTAPDWSQEVRGAVRREEDPCEWNCSPPGLRRVSTAPEAEPWRGERVGALGGRMGLLVSSFPSSFFSINNFIFRADAFFPLPSAVLKFKYS